MIVSSVCTANLQSELPLPQVSLQTLHKMTCITWTLLLGAMGPLDALQCTGATHSFSTIFSKLLGSLHTRNPYMRGNC